LLVDVFDLKSLAIVIVIVIIIVIVVFNLNTAGYLSRDM
jgi:t-SNARE complex subunit (syntaxin)